MSQTRDRAWRRRVAALAWAASVAACGDGSGTDGAPRGTETAVSPSARRAQGPSDDAGGSGADARAVAPAGRCRIEGTVTLGGRRADADVRLFQEPEPAEEPPEAPWFAGQLRQRAPAPEVGRTKAVAGAFAFEGLAAGTYPIEASADGVRGASVAELVAEGTTGRVELRLEPTPREWPLRGRVVGLPAREAAPSGPEEAPAAYVVPSDAPWGFPQLANRPWSPVGADRSFALSVPDVRSVALAVVVPGRFAVHFRPIAVPSRDEIVLDVSAGVSDLRVRVFDETTGRGVAGATVAVSSERPEVKSVGTTDRSGVCTVSCGTDRRWLYVTAPGYPRVAALEPTAGVREIEVPVRAGPVVRVRVVRASDGTPVAGAPVHVRDYGARGASGGPPPVPTDADGVALVRGATPGEALVFVLGGGWFSEGLDLGRIVGDSHSLNNRRPRCRSEWLPDSGTLELELRVLPAASIGGRVLRHDGTPAAFASVRTWEVSALPYLGQDTDFPAPTVVADAEGRFRVEGIFPAARYGFEATSPTEPGGARGQADPRRDGEVTLRFGAQHWIQVEVTDDRGAPVAGASVRCKERHDREEWMPIVAATGQTDAAGRVRAGPVLAGRYVVVVEAPNFLTPPEQSVRTGDASAARAVFRLTPGAVIRGYAVLPDGSVPEETVASVATERDRFGGGRPGLFDGLVDSRGVVRDGTFEVGGLAAGVHDVEVLGFRGDETFEGRVRAEAGGPAVEIRLSPVPAEDRTFAPHRAMFRIRVLGPDGKPVGSARVAATWSDGPSTSSSTFSVAAGSADLPTAVRGTDVTVTEASSLTRIRIDAGPLVARIPADALDGYELRLPPGRTVSGRVADERGEGLRGVRVEVLARRDPDGRFSPWGREPIASSLTRADGTFEVRGLGEGEADLVVDAPEDFEPAADVIVRGGQQDVAVTLRRGTRPVVVVLDADGSPVPLAEVSVTEEGVLFLDGSGTERSAETGDDGRATLPVLDPRKKHRLEVTSWHAGLEPWNGPWTRGPEQVVRLERKPSNTVTGRVLTADGEPAADVAVWSRVVVEEGEEHGWGSVPTDATGRFEIAELPQGAVEIAAGNFASRSHGFRGMWVSPAEPDLLASSAVRVAAGATDVEVRIPAEQTVRLRLEGIEGLLPDDELPILRTTEGGDELAPSRTRQATTFLYTGVNPAREYESWIRIPRRELLGRAEGVRAGREVVVRLERGTALAGRFVVPDGATIGGTLVVTYSIPGLYVRGTAGRDGRFVLPGLPPIAGDLSAWDDGFGSSWRASVRATPGTPVEVALVRGE